MQYKLQADRLRTDSKAAGNSGFAKKRVQWLIEHSTSHQLLWLNESFVLRNPLLRKAANRYKQGVLKTIKTPIFATDNDYNKVH